MTSYWWLILTYLLSCTVSTSWDTEVARPPKVTSSKLNVTQFNKRCLRWAILTVQDKTVRDDEKTRTWKAAICWTGCRSEQTRCTATCGRWTFASAACALWWRRTSCQASMTSWSIRAPSTPPTSSTVCWTSAAWLPVRPQGADPPYSLKVRHVYHTCLAVSFGRPMLSDRCLSCLVCDVVYCGQTVGWIKMPLGMEVGLSPGHIVLHVDPPPPKRGTAPNFWPMYVVAKWLDDMKVPLGTEVGLGPGHIVLDGDPALPRKGHSSPHFSAHVYCGQTAGWPTWYGSRPQPRRYCLKWGPSSPTKRGTWTPYCFGPCLLWPNGRPSQQLLSSCCRFVPLAMCLFHQLSPFIVMLCVFSGYHETLCVICIPSNNVVHRFFVIGCYDHGRTSFGPLYHQTN